jgi:hypothetical protein
MSSGKHQPRLAGLVLPEAATEEEAAAIVAAVQAAWPRPVVAADDPRDRTPAWRFAGRWWRKPVPMSRDRPYR